MLLPQRKALRLLKRYGISYPNTTFWKEPKKLSFPVVAKIDAPEAVHKSEFGFVILDINNETALAKAVQLLTQRARSHNIISFDILVQEQVKGVELFMGMKRDLTFGPTILFGAGGIFVEVMKDISMRIAPVNRRQAMEMLYEIKAKALLEGYRGKELVDTHKVTNMLCCLSQLALENKHIQEIDFNPVIAGQNVVVADARIIGDERA